MRSDRTVRWAICRRRCSRHEANGGKHSHYDWYHFRGQVSKHYVASQIYFVRHKNYIFTPLYLPCVPYPPTEYAPTSRPTHSAMRAVRLYVMSSRDRIRVCHCQCKDTGRLIRLSVRPICVKDHKLACFDACHPPTRHVFPHLQDHCPFSLLVVDIQPSGVGATSCI